MVLFIPVHSSRTIFIVSIRKWFSFQRFICIFFIFIYTSGLCTWVSIWLFISISMYLAFGLTSIMSQTRKWLLLSKRCLRHPWWNIYVQFINVSVRLFVWLKLRELVVLSALEIHNFEPHEPCIQTLLKYCEQRRGLCCKDVYLFVSLLHMCNFIFI